MKMGKEHRVALNAGALAVLKEACSNCVASDGLGFKSHLPVASRKGIVIRRRRPV